MAVTVDRATRLERSVGIDAPLKDVWPALLDLERVVPCLPGVEITDVDEDGAYHGTLRVKFGPRSTVYRGTLRLEAANRRACRAVVAVCPASITPTTDRAGESRRFAQQPPRKGEVKRGAEVLGLAARRDQTSGRNRLWSCSMRSRTSGFKYRLAQPSPLWSRRCLVTGTGGAELHFALGDGYSGGAG